MPSGSEVLGDRTIGRQEALRMPCGLKPLHTALALTCRPMGVLTPIIEIAALTVLYAREDLALGRAIALQLIGDDHARHVGEPLEQLAKELLRRVLIAAALHQDIEDIVVLIHRAPQVMALAIDRQEHLIEMPFIARARPASLQLIGIILPKLATPLADGLMGHVDAALEQECLHVAVAQREAIIEPDAMANDFPREAVVLVAFGGSGWRHVWRPIVVCEWFLRVHHRSEYLTGQE